MYRIRNWKRFQHYVHRCPPWIKLYREILDDKQWHRLSGEAAKGLVMLWCIAAENNGYLPDSETLAFRLRISENRVIALLSDCSHWIEEESSNVLASRYQDALPEAEKSRDRVEIEKEAEAEEAAATTAFSVLGFDRPFGHQPFQRIWLRRFCHQKPEEWLTQVMEATIQECDENHIKVPPQFYDAKRDVEHRENAAIKQRVPL